MTDINPECFHLSASAVRTFKACPTKFRLAYREGLREAESTDNQRMGTNWHALHETYQNAYQATLAKEQDAEDLDPHGAAHEAGFDAAVQHLNETYEDIPSTKSPEEWEVERQTLLMSFIGYLWRWDDDPLEFIASEVEFDLPLHSPRTGLPLPTDQVKRVGKIDTVVRWRGMVGTREMKSTGMSIDPSGPYWEKAQKDTQVDMYALAFEDMWQHGLENYGIYGVGMEERLGNTLYDVWHKPTIKPTALSQKDTAAFLKDGSYCDQQFSVQKENAAKEGEPPTITVDGWPAEVQPAKKAGAFTIRETPAMFGARLLADMTQRPDFYFQRKEIARTAADRQRFRKELFNIYQAQRLFDRTGCWYENEDQCRAPYPCPFIPICYGKGADHYCETGETPDGFTRIFGDSE